MAQHQAWSATSHRARRENDAAALTRNSEPRRGGEQAARAPWDWGLSCFEPFLASAGNHTTIEPLGGVRSGRTQASVKAWTGCRLVDSMSNRAPA